MEIETKETLAAAGQAEAGAEMEAGKEAAGTGAAEAEAGVPAPEEAASRTFTQADVDEIVGKRLERDRKAFCKRLGVEDEEGIDALLARAAEAESAKASLAEARAKIAELSEMQALLTHDVSPARYDDVRAHFKGKGIELSGESLAHELQTHPEWLNKREGEAAPKTTIQALGADKAAAVRPETPEEKRKRIFGI